MEFHNYRDYFHSFRQLGISKGEKYSEFYDWIIGEAEKEKGPRATIKTTQSIAQVEKEWFAARRPYYNIWPFVLPMLSRISLEAKGTDCKKLDYPVLIRLPQQPCSEYEYGEIKIRSILAMSIGDAESSTLLMFIDNGESHENLPSNYHLWCESTEKTVGEMSEILQSHSGKFDNGAIPLEIMRRCVSLVCGVLLLADDPELIKPAVLTNDQEKYDKTNDPKYVEKAIKRGKVGWDVGRDIEMCPHYRRPCLGLRWTGKGKTIPKIVPIKGAIVHRETVSKVPTGFFDKAEPKLLEGSCS